MAKLPVSALTFGAYLVAFGFTLSIAAGGSGCRDGSAASTTVAAPAPIATAVPSVTDMLPKPPFDTTPITPVESAGASRDE